jgi:hypothetical protein
LAIHFLDSAKTVVLDRSEIANIPTNGGKTSFYVPQLKQFYVIHPKTDVDMAGLLVYHVNPQKVLVVKRK